MAGINHPAEHNYRYESVSFFHCTPFQPASKTSCIRAFLDCRSYCRRVILSFWRWTPGSFDARLPAWKRVDRFVFCLIFLPPFLSIFAASTRMRGLLYIIAFGRAFLYSFASVALLISFGSAGWLVRFLLCFSGFFSSPFLFWLWLCCLRTGSGPSSLEVFFFVSVLLLIGSIDYRLIMPFWADLYF